MRHPVGRSGATCAEALSLSLLCPCRRGVVPARANNDDDSDADNSADDRQDSD